jgi:hypothetical protein
MLNEKNIKNLAKIKILNNINNNNNNNVNNNNSQLNRNLDFNVVGINNDDVCKIIDDKCLTFINYFCNVNIDIYSYNNENGEILLNYSQLIVDNCVVSDNDSIWLNNQKDNSQNG